MRIQEDISLNISSDIEERILSLEKEITELEGHNVAPPMENEIRNRATGGIGNVRKEMMTLSDGYHEALKNICSIITAMDNLIDSYGILRRKKWNDYLESRKETAKGRKALEERKKQLRTQKSRLEEALRIMARLQEETEETGRILDACRVDFSPVNKGDDAIPVPDDDTPPWESGDGKFPEEPDLSHLPDDNPVSGFSCGDEMHAPDEETESPESVTDTIFPNDGASATGETFADAGDNAGEKPERETEKEESPILYDMFSEAGASEESGDAIAEDSDTADGEESSDNTGPRIIRPARRRGKRF